MIFPMLTTLCKYAALVLFVLMLIAACASGAPLWGVAVTIWLASGLVALTASLTVAPWLDAHLAKAPPT